MAFVRFRPKADVLASDTMTPSAEERARAGMGRVLDAAMMSAMEPILFQRHRVFASIAVMVLFAVAITTAVLRISALEEAEIPARHEAAAQEAAQVKADFEAHKAAISASILADITGGKFDEADALLKKYQPFAHGELQALKARYDRARERSAAAKPAP